jgi:Spy/CpxP family protein refolding chaperone
MRNTSATVPQPGLRMLVSIERRGDPAASGANMKKWQRTAIIIGLFALAGVTAAAAAAGQARGKFLKHMVTSRVEEAEDYIEATPQQRQVIDQAKDAVLATLEQHMAAHRADRAQWLSLLTADTLTETQIVDAAGKRANEIRATAQEIAPQLVKVHDVLTPAQRQKLAEKARSMHRHHHGGNQGFGGPEDGGEK